MAYEINFSLVHFSLENVHYGTSVHFSLIEFVLRLKERCLYLQNILMFLNHI